MKEEKQEGLSNTERFKNVEDVCRLIGHEWEYLQGDGIKYRTCELCLLHQRSYPWSDNWTTHLFTTNMYRGSESLSD